MTSAIVFDIDGTLANTPAAIAELIGDVVRAMGASPRRSEVLATVGKPLEASLAHLLGVSADDAATAEAASRYRARFAADVLSRGPALLPPGVPEGLDRLRAAGHPLGIATSKISSSALALLEATGILGRFDTVVCHDMVQHGKPHPDMALRALADLGASPARSWYVGDTVTDVAMARAAALRTVGVSYGVDSAEALTAARADHVADDFDSVVRVLLHEAAATPRDQSGTRPEPTGALT
ncbi:HAD family hydrolase [Streptomyces sp. NPDC048566]|uniref:HAD family hydrolase n=1 Tax=Streptomyces sp. NPDC048566 TaxID=3365569 RepID=UPI003715020B